LQGELARDPNSAFLHGQIAVAYDNLNDLPAFDAQIQEAMKLDRKSAIYCYFAYAVYKRRHLDDKKIKVLQQALRIDPDNPLGHYEMASIMEDNGKWSDALAEYDRTKQLLDGVKPNQSSTDYSKWSYADPSGDPYDVTFEKDHIDADITRVRTAVSAAK
jgi:tetratricopeptide (TPR) repeat protein